ncbi:MAG: beta strand repeat-containing protein [Caulobacteraceae bacterium]
MTTKTISSYVAAGYTLAAGYDTLDITTAGGVGGTGIALNHLASLDNYGRIHAASGHNGVSASAGATIVNGSASDTTASIYGYSGVFVQNASATVANFGSITGSARFGDGVFIVAGGAVTNGSATDTTASIYADNSGISAGALATVANFGSINGYYSTGVYLKAGGAVTNGSTKDTAAVIFSYMGQGVNAVTGAATIVNFGLIHGGFGDGVILGAGGVVTNGGAKVTGATIGGETGVVAHNLAATVNNFGTINGYALANFGVYLGAGGSVTNGGANDAKAVIAAAGVGVYVYAGAAAVANFGAITSSRSVGVYMAGRGLPASEIVTNGSASDNGALIQGKTDGVAFGRFGTLDNFGTVIGQGAGPQSYGVVVSRKGVVNNGSAADTNALIQGYTGVQLDSGFVNNFGTISGSAAADGAGVLLVSAGSVANGSTSDSAALISGEIGVILNYYDLNGTVTNFGTIAGSGGTAVFLDDASDVLVVGAGSAFVGAVLGGGGTLELDNGSGTLSGLLVGGTVTVSGSMAATAFTDFDTVRIDVAASFATSGAVTLAAGQSVISSGSLTLGDKKDKVANAGTIETLGGTVTVRGAVTGAGGAASINGGLLDFASSFNQDVTFTGTTGTLELAKSQSYSAIVTGFSKTGGTALDLADIAFAGAGEATFKGSKTGGVLTVTDGTHTATINLVGDYRSNSFVASSDGHGGTIVVDSGAKAATAPPPHSFIAALAGMGGGEAAGPVHAAAEPWRRDAQALAKPA